MRTTMCRHSCRWSWIDSQTFSSQEPLTILDPPPLSETRRSWKCAIHKIILSTWTLFINVVLSQIPDFSAKKTSKTPVKQNGPAEKSSGLPSKPQMKVRKALNSSRAPEPRPAPLVCLRCFEIYLKTLRRDIFCRRPEPYLFGRLIRSALYPVKGCNPASNERHMTFRVNKMRGK